MFHFHRFRHYWFEQEFALDKCECGKLQFCPGVWGTFWQRLRHGQIKGITEPWEHGEPEKNRVYEFIHCLPKAKLPTVTIEPGSIIIRAWTFRESDKETDVQPRGIRDDDR